MRRSFEKKRGIAARKEPPSTSIFKRIVFPIVGKGLAPSGSNTNETQTHMRIRKRTDTTLNAVFE